MLRTILRAALALALAGCPSPTEVHLRLDLATGHGRLTVHDFVAPRRLEDRWDAVGSLLGLDGATVDGPAGTRWRTQPVVLGVVGDHLSGSVDFTFADPVAAGLALVADGRSLVWCAATAFAAGWVQGNGRGLGPSLPQCLEWPADTRVVEVTLSEPMGQCLGCTSLAGEWERGRADGVPIAHTKDVMERMAARVEVTALRKVVVRSLAEVYTDGERRPTDFWGGEIAYTADDVGFTLTSLGADQRPGGTGADADLVRRGAFRP